MTIEVEDDGRGISEKDYQFLFKPFVRLDKSRSREEGGFGLGLAIVKRIVDWHKGDCSIGRSTMGGAKMSIHLPYLNN